jgi:hypothetical protein
VINSTRLLVRSSKYLREHSGGKKQTGETAFGREACGDGTVLRRLRDGANVGENILTNIDNFLAARGY